MRLLVTRPQDAALRTAAKLRGLGHDVMVTPVLRIDFIPDPELGRGPFGAVVLTSANAVEALAQHRRLPELQSLTAYAVGRRTMVAAQSAGFAATSADGNQQDLARLIVEGGPTILPLLYIAGEDRTGDLGAALAAQGRTVHTIVAYRAVPVPELAGDAARALAAGRIDGVLHYSRRSAMALLQCAKAADVREAVLAAFHFCLSGPVAEPLQAAGAGKVAVAPRPEEAALLGLIPAP
jgi:uroporphyrinogen-III synthase